MVLVASRSDRRLHLETEGAVSSHGGMMEQGKKHAKAWCLDIWMRSAVILL
jgi:hypothetical protein